MKNSHRTHLLLQAAAVLGVITVAVSPARAATFYQTVNQSGASALGWSTNIWGSPATNATVGNDYITTNTFFVRTPNNSTPAAFAGSHLQLDPGGILWLKHSSGAANVNLVMNGGNIQFHGGTSSSSSPLSGTIDVQANSTISSDQTGVNARDIWLQSAISGAASWNVNMSPTNFGVIVSGNNSAYAGNWNCNGGFILITNGTTSPLGSGSVDLITTANSLIFNSTNNLAIANVIGGVGSVVKQGTNTVALSGNNSGLFGTVRVNNGVLQLQSATAISEATYIILAGGTIDATPIGGLNLNSSSGQTLNCQGTIISGLTASSGNTLNFNLTPTTNDVLNVNGSLTLNGNPTLNLTLTGFKSSGTYRLINHTGTVLGGGSFSVVPPVGSSQLFTVDTSTPGQVNLVISGVGQNLVWVGDGSANIWDTSSPNWTGAASVYTDGDNVTFNDAGSASPNINVLASVLPGAMVVSNVTKAYTFGGEGILLPGTLIKRGTNVMALTATNNNFSGPISIEAGVLSIGAGGDSGSLGVPFAITNNGVLMVNMSTNGAAVNGDISGSGSLVVTGGGATAQVTGTNSYTGPTTIGDGCQLNLTTSSALGATGSGTTVLPNGRLGVNVLVGTISVPEPVVVSGTGVPAAPGAIYVNNAGNDVTWAGPVTIAGNSRFRVVNDGARMRFSNTVLGSGVSLQASAESGTTMTFSNTLSLGGGTLTKDGTGTLTLAGASSDSSSTTVNAGTLLVNGVHSGGTITVNSTGTLGGSGTSQGAVLVQSGGTLAPGGSIGTLTVNNTVTLLGTTVMEINPTNAPNADRLVANAISFGGALTVTNVGPALIAGDSFNLFDGPCSDTFSQTNLPALPFEFVWNTSLLQSQGIISVVSNSAPIQPLLITAINRQSTNVTLTWGSNPGHTYTIQYSPNLSNWSVFMTNIPAGAGTNTTQMLDTSGAGLGSGVTLVKYQMASFSAEIQDATNLMGAGNLVKGTGVNVFSANSTQGYASDPVLIMTTVATTPDLATAVANQAWFTFVLTVGTNVTDLDLTSLTFNGARGGGASPRGYGVYVTTPTTTDELVQGATDFATQRPTWSPQSISLTGLSSLQNLTSGQVVTFQIPFYTPAAGQSVEFDDLAVSGNVSPAPGEPAYVGASKLFFRVMQE
jgi:autotransporter-associated beta strand protein